MKVEICAKMYRNLINKVPSDHIILTRITFIYIIKFKMMKHQLRNTFSAAYSKWVSLAVDDDRFKQMQTHVVQIKKVI